MGAHDSQVANRYTSMFELGEGIKRALRYTSFEDKITVEFDRYINRVAVNQRLSVANHEVLRGLTFSDDLLQILGFVPRTIFDRPKTVASREVDLERGLTAMFIYANIVDPRHLCGCKKHARRDLD